MKRKISFKKIILGIVIVLVLIVAVAAVAFKVYTSNYYVADDTAIEEVVKDLSDEVHSFETDDGMVFLPVNQQYKAVIVFYPGGRVEYKAYSGLMYRLAQRGYICLLPRMPENLALLSINAVDKLKASNAEDQAMVDGLDWYLAGHSLGGVAAVKYLATAVGKFKGVILCASYPTESLKDADLRLLSIIGSNDEVIKMAGYEDGKANWPEDSTEYVIQGGIHSYFGNYGIQKGDGEPEITAEQQLDETADVIDKWIKGE